jgi:hypothetical protein
MDYKDYSFKEVWQDIIHHSYSTIMSRLMRVLIIAFIPLSPWICGYDPFKIYNAPYITWALFDLVAVTILLAAFFSLYGISKLIVWIINPGASYDLDSYTKFYEYCFYPFRFIFNLLFATSICKSWVFTSRRIKYQLKAKRELTEQ